MTTCTPDYLHEDLIDCERRPRKGWPNGGYCGGDSGWIGRLPFRELERLCEMERRHRFIHVIEVPQAFAVGTRYQPASPADFPRCGVRL